MSDKERADRATELLKRLHGIGKHLAGDTKARSTLREIEEFLNPTPDYGEPWRARGERVEDRGGGTVINLCSSEEIQARVIQCVNSCRGVRYPGHEEPALLEQAKSEPADDDFPPLIPPVSAIPKVDESWRYAVIVHKGILYLSSNYPERAIAAEIMRNNHPAAIHQLGVFSSSEFVAWMMSRK